MIIVKVSMSGTDKKGNTFSVSAGDQVELDDRSEKSLIQNGMAEPVGKKSKK